MKQLFLILSLFTIIISVSYSQDTIVKNDGNKVICKIIKVDSSKIYFTTEKNGRNIDTYLNKSDIQYFGYEINPIQIYTEDTIFTVNGEHFIGRIYNEDSTTVYFTMVKNGTEVNTYLGKNNIRKIKYKVVKKTVAMLIDKNSFGVGGGFEYGGFGIEETYYPQKNIGIFCGGGYALVGVGYNIGFKFRNISDKIASHFVQSLLIMYGYNAAIKVTNSTDLNKMFYGVTVGVGLDFRNNLIKNFGYWSFALYYPFRGSEVDNYINELKKNYNFQTSNNLLPFGVSFGYKFIIN